MQVENNQNEKKKLSLDDFLNSSLCNEQEALEAITGGILGACHDSVSGYPPSGGGKGYVH